MNVASYKIRRQVMTEPERQRLALSPRRFPPPALLPSAGNARADALRFHTLPRSPVFFAVIPMLNRFCNAVSPHDRQRHSYYQQCRSFCSMVLREVHREI